MGVTPRHGAAFPQPPGSQAFAAPPSGKTKFPDFAGAEDDSKAWHHPGLSFCTRFRFSLWLGAVLLVIGAVVGLSVTMAMLQGNKSSGPPPSPVNEGGNGGGGSNQQAYTGPLPVPSDPPFTVPAGSQAIWWDEFDGSALNTTNWSYDLGSGEWGWGNNESETYTDSPNNVRVANGKLQLIALRDGEAITSGRINTKASAAFWPGVQLQDGTAFSSVHVEARMQLPQPGQGLWPAFWMFPSALAYGRWAASGEIDILESVNDMVTATQGLQFGGEDPNNVKNMSRTRQPGKVPYSDDYHTFAVDWTTDRITMWVDGKRTATFLPRTQDPEFGWWTSAANAPPEAPFNQPMCIIINLAVGGLWPKYPDDTTPFPAKLSVDYVRVWGTPA